jgi:hypothetical protein
MARPHLRLNWMWLLAIPAAGLGALFAWTSQRPVLNVVGEPVFYPAVVVYYGGASAVSVVLVLLGLTVLGFWVPQALGRRRRWPANGLAALLALAGGALACWASLPPTITPYRHLDRAELNGVTYQLGLRAEPSPQRFWFVLCTCDESGLNCRCRDAVEIEPELVTAPPELAADPATGRLTATVAGQTVFEYAP